MSKVLIPYDALQEKGILLSEVQIRRLEKLKKFPRRVRLSARTFAYVESEIDDYVADCIAARGVAA